MLNRWQNSERSHWRDQWISEFHRQWGDLCACVDLDWPVIEYNNAKPVALVEYKHCFAEQRFLTNRYCSQNRALAGLASNHRPPLPFFVAIYNPLSSAFKLYAGNGVAKRYCNDGEIISALEYVRLMHHLRERPLAPEIANQLSTGKEWPAISEVQHEQRH